jgi:predicted TIM-barrel fold metal-dependent hydrolase
VAIGAAIIAAVGAVVLVIPRGPNPNDAAPAGSEAKTFKPRSIPKIDMHTHIDDDSVLDARSLLLAHGIVHAVNLSGGAPNMGLEETIAAARISGDFFSVFVNINFQGIGDPRWPAREIAQLERAKALGAKGVKIPKSLGLRVAFPDGRRVPVDDPVLDPLFDAMARLDLPLAIHTGDPKAFFDPLTPSNERYDELATAPSWSFADRRVFPTWEGIVDEFERRVKRSPKTTIIGVHFGNAPEDPNRVGRMLDDYPNLWLDTAARVPEIGRKPADTRRVIMAHADRIVFGTDVQVGPGAIVLGAGPSQGHTSKDIDHYFTSTWRFFETTDRGFAHPTPIQGRWTIDGIGLPDDVLQQIYHRNAERLLHLPPVGH